VWGNWEGTSHAHKELPKLTPISAGIALGLGLAILAIVTAVGLFSSWFVDPEAPLVDHLPEAFPLGLGLVTFTLFLISWAGVALSPLSVAISLIGWLSLSLLGLRTSVRAGHRQPKHSLLSSLGQLPGWTKVALAVLLLVAAVVSVGRSYSTWDAMSAYSVRGYAIARFGSVGATTGWGSGSGYPLGVPLGIAVFRILQGDMGPVSKLIFPMFYLSLVLGMARFWIRRRVPPYQAGFGSLLFATAPVIFEHGTSGYVNLPLASTLALGMLLAIEGMLSGNPRRQLLGGVLLGLATWIRPDGLPLVAATVLGLLIAVWIGRLPRPAWRSVLIPTAIIAGIWQTYSWILAPAGAQTATANLSTSILAKVSQGTLNLDAFYWIGRFSARQIVDPRAWGLVLPLGLMTILIKRRLVFDRDLASSFALLPIVACTAAAFVMFYYLISFRGDLIYWLGTDVNRMLILPAAVAWTWLVSLWSATGPDQPPADSNPAQPANEPA
jgi:hypothetical protein